MIGSIYYFFSDSVPETAIEAMEWVGDVTDSEAARLGAGIVLFPASVAFTAIGIIVTTVIAGPALILYTAGALIVAGVKATYRAFKSKRAAA